MPAHQRFLPDDAATARLGEDIAMALRVGDVVALEGDLGAGKTTLARGLIRALAGDPGLDVPSPTFTLVQAYAGRIPVAHFDLYRLAGAAELDELGFDEALAEGAVLVEWPDRAGNRLPDSAIRVRLTHEGEGRQASVEASGPAAARIARSLAIRDFLAASGRGDGRRTPLGGDASARGYERLDVPDEPQRLIMDSPPLVLGPPVRNGKAYAEIAHTSRTVAAFVAIDRTLSANGVTVPDILAMDLDRGFLVVENLGEERFLVDGRPDAARYAAAAELLAMMHGKSWPLEMPVGGGPVHQLPLFDREALAIEVDLLLDWYVPYLTGHAAGPSLRAGWNAAWSGLFSRLESAEQSIVLRDYHSPNIVWRGDRKGHDRLGILDFQDALHGPAAYDIASLAMDARVTVPPQIERSTVAAYVAARRAAGSFDADAFAEAYAIMAAQRNAKILGIFVRLDRRDGKPQYLGHLPRIRDYLARALSHPTLATLKDLFVRNRLLEPVA